MNLDSTFHRSPKNALKYYYITSFIGLIVVLVILSILYYCWSTYNWWNFILYILITVRGDFSYKLYSWAISEI